MIKLQMLLLCLVIVSIGYAQKDPEAEKVLIAAEKKITSYKTIQANFEYQVKGIDESIENYKGKVFIKGKKYLMEIDGTITYSNGKTRWVYLVDSKEVNVSNLIDEEELGFEERFLVDPLSIYSIYKEGFKLLYNEKKDKNKESIIDLSPEDLNKNFFKIRTVFNASNDLLSVKYFLKDGTRMTLLLSEWQFNKKLNDSMFEFKPKEYPDVEVIDLR